jgi:hypothetical protein
MGKKFEQGRFTRADVACDGDEFSLTHEAGFPTL